MKLCSTEDLAEELRAGVRSDEVIASDVVTTNGLLEAAPVAVDEAVPTP